MATYYLLTIPMEVSQLKVWVARYMMRELCTMCTLYMTMICGYDLLMAIVTRSDQTDVLLLVYRMMRKIYLLHSIQKWCVILWKKRNKQMTGYQT